MKVKIMRGIPGSGKSTFWKKNYPGALVCSANDYFMVEGIYKFNRYKLSEAHGACLRKFMDAIAVNANNMRVNCPAVPHPVIVVDNTNISAVEVAPYAALALAYRYELEVITLAAMPGEVLGRQLHGVPEKTIVRMYDELYDQTDLFPQRWPHRFISS